MGIETVGSSEEYICMQYDMEHDLYGEMSFLIIT